MGAENISHEEAYDNLIQILGRLNMFGDLLSSFGDDLDDLNKGSVVTMGLSMMDDARQGNELVSKLIGQSGKLKEKSKLANSYGC